MSAHENGDSTDGIGVNTDVPSDMARSDRYVFFFAAVLPFALCSYIYYNRPLYIYIPRCHATRLLIVSLGWRIRRYRDKTFLTFQPPSGTGWHQSSPLYTLFNDTILFMLRRLVVAFHCCVAYDPI